MEREIRISDYDYELPDERIARFPLADRDASKLLVYRNGELSDSRFHELPHLLPEKTLLVFNNTRVVRARIVMHKPSGARIELLCLEPRNPADYERAFAAQGEAEWYCIVGNLKKWKEGALEIRFDTAGKSCRLQAHRIGGNGAEQIVKFDWDADLTFGQLLETLGRVPIPPYLGRDSEEIDKTRYQTVYAQVEGSVAAPTAGLHFTPELIEQLRQSGRDITEVTLHVGAGTFLPVKEENALLHPMHTEHFEATRKTVGQLLQADHVTAVGTTSVRTLESLAVLGHRIIRSGSPNEARTIGQFEPYDLPEALSGKEALQALFDYMERNNLDRIRTATQIMITPGFRYRIVRGMITNFHQPKSTLLLLIAAFVGEEWHRIYDYALKNGFRFLSYGDSSLLLP